MKKIIIFDFDGVIADSFEYCLKKNQSLDSSITAEEYRTRFHDNFYRHHRKLVGDKEVNRIQALYWIEFAKDLDEIQLFPKMSKILHRLSKKYQMVIVSSCKDDLLEQVLNTENIRVLFQSIYGSSYHESKVEKFKHAMRDFNVKPEDCIFITDTLGDLVEAEKADLESIAVSWGFHDADTLSQGKHKVLIHKPEKLIKEIDKHFLSNRSI